MARFLTYEGSSWIHRLRPAYKRKNHLDRSDEIIVYRPDIRAGSNMFSAIGDILRAGAKI